MKNPPTLMPPHHFAATKYAAKQRAFYRRLNRAACKAGFLAGLLFCLPANPLAAQTAQVARDWVTPLPGNALRGQTLYQARCTECHAVDSNKIGPAHRGVVGRRVGSLPGYTYSTELGTSRLRWTPQTLNAWLEDPEELVRGQRMGFQVDDAQERADLIAYLASLK